jgi:hypothetical protein
VCDTYSPARPSTRVIFRGTNGRHFLHDDSAASHRVPTNLERSVSHVCDPIMPSIPSAATYETDDASLGQPKEAISPTEPHET